MENTLRYSETRRITLLGAAKNAVLGLLKIIFGWLGHSHALFADGVHSLSDLLIDLLVLVASHFGSKGADSDHPYGHGRIETAATFLLAFVLSLAGVGIIIDASMNIIDLRTSVQPSLCVMLIALLSVLANEVLYRYTRYVGERIESKLLITNAWHHWSDSASSMVVLLGVAGAWLGWGRLDAIAAIIVGAMIIKMAWQFGWASIRELVDTGLDDAMVEQIRHSIEAVPGVRALHQLRTRSLGGAIFLDTHILVDPTISVSEGHFIGQQVHFRLLKEITGVKDVVVHIDPEDDEVVAPARDLPTRAEIITLLQQRWGNFIRVEDIDNTTLHYLAGKIYLEIRLPLVNRNDNLPVEQLIAQLRQALADRHEIAGVQVFLYT